MIDMAEDGGDEAETVRLFSSDNVVANQQDIFEHDKKGCEENMCKTDTILCLPSDGIEDISSTHCVDDNLEKNIPTSTISNEEEKTKDLKIFQATFSPTEDKKNGGSKIVMKWEILPTSSTSSSINEKDEPNKEEEDSKKTNGKKSRGEEPAPCHLCKKIFKNIFRLNNHLRNKHNGDVTFTCEVCGKEFTYARGLRRHSRIHSEEKRFKCELCDKAFRYKHHLKVHLTIHAGEKPFECQYCSKHFNRKFNLKEHLRVHTGAKPYQCELCLKQFTQKSSLNNHMKVHNVKPSNKKGEGNGSVS